MAKHGLTADEERLVQQIEEMRRLLRLMNDTAGAPDALAPTPSAPRPLARGASPGRRL